MGDTGGAGSGPGGEGGTGPGRYRLTGPDTGPIDSDPSPKPPPPYYVMRAVGIGLTLASIVGVVGLTWVGGWL